MALPTNRHGWHWPHLLLLALLWPASALGPSIPDTLRLASWLVFNLALLGFVERLVPQRVDWHPTSTELVGDAGLLGLNDLIDAVFKLGMAAIALPLVVVPPSPLPGWAAFVLGVIAAELGSYLLHRLSHEGGWLWRVHLLHHRPEKLHVANALSVHPIHAVLDGLARFLPLSLLGLDSGTLMQVTMFHLTQAVVSHANIRGHIGPLQWLVGDAERHRLHHSCRRSDAGNFGTDIPLWDLLLGTHRHGPAPAEVGLFDRRQDPQPGQWGRLLAFPFLRTGMHRACCGPAR